MKTVKESANQTGVVLWEFIPNFRIPGYPNTSKMKMSICSVDVCTGPIRASPGGLRYIYCNVLTLIRH